MVCGAGESGGNGDAGWAEETVAIAEALGRF